MSMCHHALCKLLLAAYDSAHKALETVLLCWVDSDVTN
jgi:hypothetical protein